MLVTLDKYSFNIFIFLSQQLESEIEAYSDRFAKLDAKVIESKQKHSSLDTSYVEKENGNLQKR